MQIVIDMPNSTTKEMLENYESGSMFDEVLRGALKQAIILPKGHSDLIYRDEIEYMKAIHDLKWGKITASECATKIKYSAPTIIEADKPQKKAGIPCEENDSGYNCENWIP